MTESIDDVPLARIEEASLNVMQSVAQLFYDGWLLGLMPGPSKRTRSVNAAFGSTLALAHKIARCEALYAQHGLPALFRITPFVQPRELDDVLDARGYQSFEPTLVQAIALREHAAMPCDDTGVRVVDADMFARASAMLRGGATPPQRTAPPLASCLTVIEEDGQVVAAGRAVLDDEVAGLFDLITAAPVRRRGHASRLTAALVGWARRQHARVAYLQVTAGNAPALAVYAKFGFRTCYAYHYRGRAGECA